LKEQTVSDTQYDIIIVGGAMTGATLACALADTGLRIAVVDSRALSDPGSGSPGLEDTVFDARVSAITPASQEIFTRLGLWSHISAQRASPYSRMYVWEADGTASIDFAAADINVPVLGHIVENRVILNALHQRLADLDNIERVAPTTINDLLQADDGVRLILDNGDTLQARVLVGADGARSAVRRMAGFSVREWDYHHQAIVTTVRTEKPHQQTAWQRFMDDGVLAFLPMHTPAGPDGQRYCSIVWSLLPERAEQLMVEDDARFMASLERGFESRLGAVESVAQRFSFPLGQVHARDYVSDPVVLIGDAAHSIHPLAGQGANLGLLDAWVLARTIMQAQKKAEDLWHHPSVLRRYQRRRKGHNLAMMALMEGFRRLYAEQPLPVRWLRNVGMRTVDNLPLLKNHLMREAMGLDQLDSGLH